MSRAGRAPLMPIGLLFAACLATSWPDGGVDAGADAGPDAVACDPGCHWDCFGGSQCVDGVAWLNAFAPRECCHYTDPWPGPGPTCANWSFACSGGACVSPDPRYRACLHLLGRWMNVTSQLEYVRLYCPQGAPKAPGSPCSTDADCRPATEGFARLHCDHALTPAACAEVARPDAAADYSASCGLADASVPWLLGEAVVSSPNCRLCQVLRTDACLRQGCTTACTFDEDCPEGSVCLCGESGFLTVGYCAAATDRTTAEGRAAGLAACP